MHFIHDSLHDFNGARCASCEYSKLALPYLEVAQPRRTHNAAAKSGDVDFAGFELRVFELGNEHGRHALQHGALLVLHGLERRIGTEGVRGIDELGAVRECREIGHDVAEAVEQRHGRHDHVIRCQMNALAHEESVVENVRVRQHLMPGEVVREGHEC